MNTAIANAIDNDFFCQLLNRPTNAEVDLIIDNDYSDTTSSRVFDLNIQLLCGNIEWPIPNRHFVKRVYEPFQGRWEFGMSSIPPILEQFLKSNQDTPEASASKVEQIGKSEAAFDSDYIFAIAPIKVIELKPLKSIKKGILKAI